MGMPIGRQELLGFVELKVGSIEVRVPLRKMDAPPGADSPLDSPLARFTMDGGSYAIMVRDKDESPPMMAAVERACEEAVRQLSKKLLS